MLGERFLVLYGDTYLRIDYGAAARAWIGSARPAMMTVLRNGGAGTPQTRVFDGDAVIAYESAPRPVDGVDRLRARRPRRRRAPRRRRRRSATSPSSTVLLARDGELFGLRPPSVSTRSGPLPRLRDRRVPCGSLAWGMRRTTGPRVSLRRPMSTSPRLRLPMPRATSGLSRIASSSSWCLRSRSRSTRWTGATSFPMGFTRTDGTTASTRTTCWRPPSCTVISTCRCTFLMDCRAQGSVLTDGQSRLPGQSPRPDPLSRPPLPSVGAVAHVAVSAHPHHGLPPL